MSKVYNLNNAKEQGEADCNQGIHNTQAHGINELLNKNIHEISPP